jgi:twitching motility two-component system response regulator PilG
MPAPDDGSLAEKTSTMGGQGGVAAVGFIDVRALGGREGIWVRWPRFYPNLALAEAVIGQRQHGCWPCVEAILPVYDALISIAPPSEAQGTGKVADLSRLRGVRVMVIDDSNTIRRSAEIFLVQVGCQVVLAEDGFDALAKIADHQPNVIFCDIMMPRLDGYQTCSLIKKNPKFKATPVIMLSSKDGLFDRARGRMVGSDQYLTKPFTKDSLLQTVAQFALPAETESNS